jgi:DMSO/TMAO reductase YedYZ molybdopterin-dependent catalytic subunit
MPQIDQGEGGKILPPGQRTVGQILRWGIDHPGITFANPKKNLETWTLTVYGDVEKPLVARWSDFLTYPKTISTNDFHCVEGWSVLGCKWEGIRFRLIVSLVKPKESAKFVTFGCSDGYTTSFNLADLLGDDILLAHRLNDNDLEESLGGPLRLVFPSKYAYKSAMWVNRIIFTQKKEVGYWEKRGYSDTADVWKNDRFSR